MKRSTLVVAVLLAATAPALAQSRSWVPWGEPGGGGKSYSYAPSSSAKAKPHKATPQFWQDDDDDDDAPRSRPGASLPYQKSNVQYPAVIEGGARPEIDPKAPPVVAFSAGYEPHSIIIDTSQRALYYVINSQSAYRYPISVGRDGFRWQGTEKISRVQAWPDWHPPVEMRERDPRLPEVMTGGIRNPLGAKALYLGNSLYRIHGTNDARSIGYAASSGCFRMMNYHVLHLATMAGPGTTVHVLEHLHHAEAAVAPSKAKGARKG